MAIYREIYQGPARNYSTTSARKKYIAIHNTSNDASSKDEMSYAKRRTDSVSSHYYADRVGVIQALDTKLKAWHAGSSEGNTYAIAYEITGTNSKSRSWWLSNVNWDALAKAIARDMKEWGIKNQRLSVSQMRAGNVTGIVTHDDMRRAWGGTSHTDPGSNFPMDHLISKINQYLNPPKEDNETPTSDLGVYDVDLKTAFFTKGKNSATIYFGDGMVCRGLPNQTVWETLVKKVAAAKGVDPDTIELETYEDAVTAAGVAGKELK